MNKNGIIFDIKKYALQDGPGIRTTVFLKGCPLNCSWCHNPESKSLEPEIIKVKRTKNGKDYVEDEIFGKVYDVEQVISVIKKDTIFYDESNGGVTFSGGEPLLQADFLNELLDKCRAEQIHTAIDTSGYALPETVEDVVTKADLFLFDIKLYDEEDHKKYTGVSNKRIIENLKILEAYRVDIIIRIPLIPGITDTEKNLLKIIEFLNGFTSIKKIELLPYNELSASKCGRFNLQTKMENLQVQSKEKLFEILKICEHSKIPLGVRGINE